MRKHPKSSLGKLLEHHTGPAAAPRVIQACRLYLCGGSCAWQPHSSRCGTACRPTSGPFSLPPQGDLRQSSPAPGFGHSAHRQLHKARTCAAQSVGVRRRQRQDDRGPAKQTPLRASQSHFSSSVLLATAVTLKPPPHPHSPPGPAPCKHQGHRASMPAA